MNDEVGQFFIAISSLSLRKGTIIDKGSIALLVSKKLISDGRKDEGFYTQFLFLLSSGEIDDIRLYNGSMFEKFFILMK